MKKHVKPEHCFSRPFGTNVSSPPQAPEPLQTTLFMKLGTRVATVVAHYEHKNPPVVVSATSNCRQLPAISNPTYSKGEVPKSSLKAKFDTFKEAVILETEEPIYENVN